MALATSTIATIAAIGTVVSAVGAISAGVAQSKQAKFQAAVARQQAEQARLKSASEEKDFRRRQSRAFATRRAALGASGVEATTGSPLLVSEDFVGEAELQALRIRQGGEVRATRLEQQASLFQAKGRSARTAGFFRGGSLLLSNAGTFNSVFTPKIRTVRPPPLP